MEKSAEAFRTISEVADELEVPKHVLRFWEGKFTQIKPMKRGGGRRYYRPEDVELLRGIRRLLHEEGYTIKGVQKVIRQSGLEFVKQVWREAGEPAPGGPVQEVKKPTKPIANRLSKVTIAVLQKVLNELEGCQDLLEAAD